MSRPHEFSPSPFRAHPRSIGAYLRLFAVATLLASCAAPEPKRPALTAAEGRALVARHIPARISDREGWAADVYGAFASLKLDPSPANICAALAVLEQESGYQADPAVPNLGKAARQEIEVLRERAGIPKLAVMAALQIPSTDGRSYDQRIDDVRTERELSELFEEIIGRVPLGTRLLAHRNPVRTGGPMQVSIAYAQSRADAYPYPVGHSIRHEVFTRRGGLFFGIAHLLDYPAPYDDLLYRYADFNAGHYASRNAAFQRALWDVSGVKLELDGDLLRYVEGKPSPEVSATEAAARSIAKRLRLDEADIRSDLERGPDERFDRTRLYQRLFEIADRPGKPAPRALVPKIDLKSSKFTRKLTTEWFARRVAERHKACLARGRT
jgi:hypothetical protein